MHLPSGPQQPPCGSVWLHYGSNSTAYNASSFNRMQTDSEPIVTHPEVSVQTQCISRPPYRLSCWSSTFPSEKMEETARLVLALSEVRQPPPPPPPKPTSPNEWPVPAWPLPCPGWAHLSSLSSRSSSSAILASICTTRPSLLDL